MLILGKDGGDSLDRTEEDRIQARPARLPHLHNQRRTRRSGESVVQKVMRYALSSKFVLIENTDPSGHLYEIPHVAKAAECVTVVLQEEGRGATWMFEDAYAKHKHWHKLTYKDSELEHAVELAAAWAEKFVRDFADYQATNLPWLKR